MIFEYLSHLTIIDFVVMAFLFLPPAALIWFGISLTLFLITPKDSPKRRPRRIVFIISATVAGVFLSMIASVVALFFMVPMGM